jgi:anthranilate synthase component 1
MVALQKELALHQYIKIPEVPTFTGGAIGYVAYDCIQHFEPKTKCELNDTLGIPEAVFMFVDTLLIYDHIFQTLKVVSHVFIPKNFGTGNLALTHQQRRQDSVPNREQKPTYPSYPTSFVSNY